MDSFEQFVDKQSVELKKLEDEEVERLLKIYDEERIYLSEELDVLIQSNKKNIFTAIQIAAFMSIIKPSVGNFVSRFMDTYAASQEKYTKAAIDNLVSIIERHDKIDGFVETLNFQVSQKLSDGLLLHKYSIENSGNTERQDKIADFRDTLNFQVSQRLSEGLLLHKYSIENYGNTLLNQMKNQLSRSVLANMTYSEMKDLLVARNNSVFASMKARAELIVRMELSAAYNYVHQIALEEAATLLDKPGTTDPLMKKADEYFDHRNHPFSRVIHGMVVGIKEEWRVSIRDVEKMASQMNKPAKGILWRTEGSYYVGGAYPAHYNERGRQVPWRNSWKT